MDLNFMFTGNNRAQESLMVLGHSFSFLAFWLSMPWREKPQKLSVVGLYF
jgi:hypothetical protein